MNEAAFTSVAFPRRVRASPIKHPSARACAQSSSSSSSSSSSPPAAGTPATGAIARRLATWMAADWSNKKQAMENPQFWAHIHVCFRPLPWRFLHAYSFYCESAYDYNLGAPYKTSVVRIEHDGSNQLELASYKIKHADEFWMGAYEPQLLESLTVDMLTRLPDACNTTYEWQPQKGVFMGASRPGKGCRIRRGGKERETYLDSKLMLSEHCYAAWDVGRDPDTDERVWGTPAGPFVFEAVCRLDHLVPQEEREETAAFTA